MSRLNDKTKMESFHRGEGERELSIRLSSLRPGERLKKEKRLTNTQNSNNLLAIISYLYGGGLLERLRS